MPLPTFATIDEVPESFRELYAEKDGKVVPKIENPDGFLGNYSRLEREAKERADRLKAYDGLDPEKARAALTAAEQAEAEKQRAAGDWASREQSLTESWQKRYDAEVTARTTLEQKLNAAIADRDVADAIAAEKGKAKLLKPALAGRVKVEVVDGELRSVVYGEDGKPAYHDGAPMTVRQLVASLKSDPEFMPAFDGTTASGGGATGSVAHLGGRGFDLKTASAAEKTAYIGQHGLAAYQELILRQKQAA
jgi:hypothetical protein